MILREFSKYIQKHNQDLMMHKVTPIELLHKWLYFVIAKTPKNNVEKIIHAEILFCKNDTGDYFIAGKSDSGRKLVTALINFAQSYENYNHAKWMEMLEQNIHSK